MFIPDQKRCRENFAAIYYLTEDYKGLLSIAPQVLEDNQAIHKLFEEFNWSPQECLKHNQSCTGVDLTLSEEYQENPKKDEIDLPAFQALLNEEIVAILQNAGFTITPMDHGVLACNLTKEAWFNYKRQRMAILKDYYVTVQRLLSSGIMVPDSFEGTITEYSERDNEALQKYFSLGENNFGHFIEFNLSDASYFFGGTLHQYLDSFIPLFERKTEITRYLLPKLTGCTYG